jgi:hypothetical protein
VQHAPSPIAVERTNGYLIYIKFLQPYILLKPESLAWGYIPWGGSKKQYFQKIEFVINSKILNLLLFVKLEALRI